MTQEIQPSVTYSYELRNQGILVFKQMGDDKKLPHQFIRIATLADLSTMRLLLINSTQRMKVERELVELQDQLDREEITQQRYNNLIDKLYDNIFVRVNSYRSISKQDFISQWKTERFQNKIKENLLNLMKLNIEIIPITLHKTRRLVLLLERGPIYNFEISEKEITNRVSPLDIYIDIKGLKQLINYDPDHGIRVLPDLPSNHPQAIEIPDHIFELLLGKFTQQNNPVDFRVLQKYFLVSSQIYPNYLLSIPYFTEEQLVLDPKNYTRYLHCSLKHRNSLLVNSSHSRFHEFMQSYIDSIKTSTPNPVKNKSDNGMQTKNKVTQRVFHFGRQKISGFKQENLEEVRLGMIDFETQNGVLDFGFVFKMIDLIFGEKYFSSQSAWTEAIDDLREYFDDGLSDIVKYNDLVNLMQKQLDLSSVIGHHQSIAMIYQLLRQYSMSNILDSVNPTIRTSNLLDHPYLSHFDTSDLQIHNVVLSLILILYKTAQYQKELTDLTIVISDHDVVEELLSERIMKVVTSILQQSRLRGLRLILFSSDPRIIIKSIDFPILSLSEFDPKELQFHDTLKIGTGIEINVKLI